VSAGLPIQVGALARRSITRTLRQPASVIPPIVFPLMLMAVNSGGLESATQLPGFPSDSFYAFALAVPFIQGALFTTMNAGTDLARDIQNGFFNRLSLTPIRAPALLAGQLAGNIVLGLARAVIYVIAGLVIGVLARALVPGRQSMSLVAKIVLGVIAAVVGGLLWNAVFPDNEGIAWIGSIVVAVVLLLIYARVAPNLSRRRV